MIAVAAASRLATPRPVRVRVDGDGLPCVVGRAAVEAVREDWVVEDRWWTDRKLRRRYFELVLENGRNAIVFHDLIGGKWFEQRG